MASGGRSLGASVQEDGSQPCQTPQVAANGTKTVIGQNVVCCHPKDVDAAPEACGQSERQGNLENTLDGAVQHGDWRDEAEGMEAEKLRIG